MSGMTRASSALALSRAGLMKNQPRLMPTEIDAKLLADLEDLKKRARVSKRALVEQAVRLLIEQYRTMVSVYKNGVVDNQFMALVDETMKQYGRTMKNLAR